MIRRRSGVASAWVVSAALLGVWCAARLLVAAFVAWPLLVPEAGLAAVLAVYVTSPRPRAGVVELDREGQ